MSASDRQLREKVEEWKRLRYWPQSYRCGYCKQWVAHDTEYGQHVVLVSGQKLIGTCPAVSEGSA